MLVALAILLGLAALLAVPLGVAFQLEGLEPFAGRLTIRWLFGLVRVRVAAPGARRPPAEPSAEPKAKRKRARRESRPGRASRVLAVLRQAEFRRRAGRLAADLVRAAHPSRLRLRMRLGLGDPADTGRLWAVVGPLGAASRWLPGADVRIEPEFVEPVLEFEARGRLLVIPLQVLALAVSFALSPASIRAWRALWSGHA
jgi:DUF2953 family protein